MNWRTRFELVNIWQETLTMMTFMRHGHGDIRLTLSNFLATIPSIADNRLLSLKLLLPRKKSSVLGVLALLVQGPEVQVAVLAEQLLQPHPIDDLLPENLERRGARPRSRPDVAPGQRPRRPPSRLRRWRPRGVGRVRSQGRGQDAHGGAEGRRAAHGAAPEDGPVDGLARAERRGQVERRWESLQFKVIFVKIHF